jgi:hypothetical protein
MMSGPRISGTDLLTAVKHFQIKAAQDKPQRNTFAEQPREEKSGWQAVWFPGTEL